MASWHETTFAPVREARRLWLRTDDQLSLEVDDLTSLPVCDRTPPVVRGTNGSGAPATGSSLIDNAASSQSSWRARELAAKGA